MTDDSIAQLRSHESKVCTKCGIERPLSQYAKHKGIKGGLRPDCKTCRQAYNRVHYAKHRDKVLERQKRRYAENPERVRSYYRRYYADNKGDVLSKNKAWKRENWDHYSRQQRAYVEANRERENAKSRKWAQNNPEKRRAIQRHANHERRLKVSSGISSSALNDWVEAQEPTCFYCGADCSDGQFEIDHFHPLARGGAHEFDNLRIACRSCNRRKSARDPYEFMANMEP